MYNIICLANFCSFRFQTLSFVGTGFKPSSFTYIMSSCSALMKSKNLETVYSTNLPLHRSRFNNLPNTVCNGQSCIELCSLLISTLPFSDSSGESMLYYLNSAHQNHFTDFRFLKQIQLLHPVINS